MSQQLGAHHGRERECDETRDHHGTRQLLWQNLHGAWPLSEERAQAYALKAVREAKLHTSWLDPQSDYEDRVQEVKKIVSRLKQARRSEAEASPRVYRPWGSYETVAQGDRFQVKRIIVKPGQKLSLQMHHHRAEHWIVVKGTARVWCGDKNFLLCEDQSTHIPLGQTHRLENPGKVQLELIEVQSGAYLGEDDIVRFEDRYGREGQTG